MNKDYKNVFENELDIRDLFLILFKRKLLISIITSTAAILSITYSLSLPNIYTSKTLLAPVSTDDSLSSKLGGSFSSLAGLSGFTLPGENATKGKEGIERIKSFEFFSTYLLPNIKLEDIFAVKNWDSSTNTIIYNKKLFNQKESKWVRKVSHPKKIIPSDQEAYEKYIDIMRITENKQTSFVTLSIDHESPIMAKNWVEIIIKNINQSMREEEEKKAQSSINFLNESAKLTNIQSLKDAISSLLESQMQILMLAASNDDYIFKIIDSPIAPEEKSSPRRALICIIGTLLGVALSLFITFFQYYREAYRKS